MRLQDFLARGISPFHVVETGAEYLALAGFQEVDLGSLEVLTPGDYYCKSFGTALFAFRWRGKLDGGLRLVGAHTDVPTIKVKPQGLLHKDNYAAINGEIYGGMVMHTWVDRPLALAGKVYCQGKDPFKPKERLVDSQRPLAMIPGLAIHMNRQVNEGFTMNRQKEFIPVLMGEQGLKLEDILQDILGSKEEILGFDLNLYPVEKNLTWGYEEEFYTGYGLDNLVSCWAALKGLVAKAPTEGLVGIALFDHEEVGSRSKQGAASLGFRDVLQCLWGKAGGKAEDFPRFIQGGYMLSMDAAHGKHPNYPEYADPTHAIELNKGVVIKKAANQAYATDGQAMAVVRGLCNKFKIPYQVFVNHNNHPGGSTIGSIGSTILPMVTADVGVPLWSMHSARETMGVKDGLALEALAKAWLDL